MNRVESLGFDSELFGYPTGKAILDSNSSLAEIKRQAESFRMVYLIADQELNIEVSSVLLSGETVQFRKKVVPGFHSQTEVEVLKEMPNQALLDLAFQSGVFSRFRVDSRLRGREFEKLYSLWLEKEFREGKVFVINKKQGLITVRVNEKKAEIGLFATDTQSRRLGLGTKLLRHLESYLWNLGVKELWVKTQRANEPALKFYLKNGFKEVESRFIYHYWKE